MRGVRRWGGARCSSGSLAVDRRARAHSDWFFRARITIDRGGLEVGLGSVKPPYVERRGASSVLPRTSIYPPRARPIETLERDRDTIGGGEMRKDGGVGKSTESV